MTTQAQQIAARVEDIDWSKICADLDTQGWAVLPKLLYFKESDAIKHLYAREGIFRKKIIMAQHGFGRGEYQYFAYPLPAEISALRIALYSHLASVANRWHATLGIDVCFPAQHATFIQRCHKAGQTRPTPLLLRYGKDDYNCLHQDLYGEHVFPLQVAALLSKPGKDFEGGEFVLTEQSPRRQSRALVVPLNKGDGVVFAVNCRPVQGTRRPYRVTLRHGVSTLLAGRRHTLGIIFHDAA